MSLIKHDSHIQTFEFNQKIAPGVVFPARSTVCGLGDGHVVIISPGPFDEDSCHKIRDLGDKFVVIAPNLFHHFYFLKTKDLFPGAQLFAPRALGKKVKATLDQYQPLEDLPSHVTTKLRAVFIEGNKVLQEWVFLHEATDTLIITDLVFNMGPQPMITSLALKAAGAYNKLAQSRLVKVTISDRAKFVASINGLSELKAARIIPAHGKVISDAKIWSNFVESYK